METVMIECGFERRVGVGSLSRESLIVGHGSLYWKMNRSLQVATRVDILDVGVCKIESPGIGR